MFEIRHGEDGNVIIAGRFDASQEPKARAFLDSVNGNIVVDARDLEYISSAGIGVLLGTLKRLKGKGGGLKLVNVTNHIKDVFFFSGLSKVFEIEEPRQA